MPGTAIVVPCRLESTRFPRKLLHNIRGKPLILWVAERVRAEAPQFETYFAVDHPLLEQTLRRAGFSALMTSPDHASGTDRIAEANRTIQAERIVNVQGDEPLVSGRQIAHLAALLDRGWDMATLATPFQTAVDWSNPNQVKVVCAADGRALYFSRAAMPYPRDAAAAPDNAWVKEHPCWRHLGLYAYTADLLAAFSSMPPGRLERIEKLEQLRVLENGRSIGVGITDDLSIGVDTPEDAVRFEALLANQR